MKVLVVAGIVVALYGLHRLALWCEARGWIYYLRKKPDPASLGTALLELQQMAQPDRRHVMEARRKRRADRPAPGDPPKPGQS